MTMRSGAEVMGDALDWLVRAATINRAHENDPALFKMHDPNEVAELITEREQFEVTGHDVHRWRDYTGNLPKGQELK